MDKVQKIKEEIERRISNLEQLGDRKEIEIYFPTQFNFIKSYEGLLQFINSLPEESASEDLEEAAKEYSFNIPTQLEADSAWKKETEQYFKDGAKWHENKMKEALQAEYEKGLFDMREEMMKNTVLETKVMRDCDGDGIEIPYEEWLTLENTEILYIPEELGLKEGDRVKIIIVKED